MREFIDEVSNRKQIERKDLVEKDILIQAILLDLSKDDFFAQNLAFKGGTCLIKCYLGYHRFSEDIDFTWIDQSIFKDKSQKKIRKIISDLKDKIGELFVTISKNRELDFILDKNNKKYFEFGGGNKFITFKLWYTSEILKEPSFIKIQLNFVEHIRFNISKKKADCLLEDTRDEKFEALYGKDYKDYVEDIVLYTYDVKEIVCEKIRAILTRQGVKARDFVDIYLISQEYGIKVQDVKSETIEKIKLILDLYQKYRSNLVEKIKLLESDDFFQWGSEKELLLEDIDEQQFNKFVKEFQYYLQGILKVIV